MSLRNNTNNYYIVCDIVITHAGRNYSMHTKFEGKILLGVNLAHENITQQINSMTKLSRTNFLNCGV